MLKKTFFPTAFMAVALLVFALLAASHALAFTFTVNSTLDEPDSNVSDGQCISAPSEKCTLRAAVMQANVVNIDTTILVPSGIYTLIIPPVGPDGPETGDLNLTTPVSGSTVITIIGAGANTTILDGNQLDRMFYVHSGRTAIISGVTIRNGYFLPFTTGGGGIYSAGTLTVTNSTISGNQAGFHGGGIYNFGKLTVTNSTISGNQAGFFGGGIFNQGNINVISTLTVTNSTISFNQARGNGGGIHNQGGSLTVTNSTISQNNANTYGGGIFNNGIANVYNTSIILNGADADNDPNGGSGGGVYNDPGATFNLRNTLVAGNTQTTYVYDDCKGTLNVYGWNLLWDVIGCFVNDGVGGSWNFLNSLGTLGPLQNNGGPTWTHALLPGSNAIDGGHPAQGCLGPNSFPLATDQRGAARVVGIRCDIGAFEYGAKVSQSIQFGPISNKTLADSPFVITATSSSDLFVDFSTNTPSICTVTGGPLITGVSSATVVLNGGGTCTLVAQQPGNQIFDPAIAVTQAFNVSGNVAGNKTFLPLILR